MNDINAGLLVTGGVRPSYLRVCDRPITFSPSGSDIFVEGLLSTIKFYSRDGLIYLERHEDPPMVLRDGHIEFIGELEVLVRLWPYPMSTLNSGCGEVAGISHLSEDKFVVTHQGGQVSFWSGTEWAGQTKEYQPNYPEKLPHKGFPRVLHLNRDVMLTADDDDIGAVKLWSIPNFNLSSKKYSPERFKIPAKAIIPISDGLFTRRYLIYHEYGLDLTFSVFDYFFVVYEEEFVSHLSMWLDDDRLAFAASDTIYLFSIREWRRKKRRYKPENITFIGGWNHKLERNRFLGCQFRYWVEAGESIAMFCTHGDALLVNLSSHEETRSGWPAELADKTKKYSMCQGAVLESNVFILYRSKLPKYSGEDFPLEVRYMLYCWSLDEWVQFGEKYEPLKITLPEGEWVEKISAVGGKLWVSFLSFSLLLDGQGRILSSDLPPGERCFNIPESNSIGVIYSHSGCGSYNTSLSKEKFEELELNLIPIANCGA